MLLFVSACVDACRVPPCACVRGKGGEGVPGTGRGEAAPWKQGFCVCLASIFRKRDSFKKTCSVQSIGKSRGLLLSKREKRKSKVFPTSQIATGVKTTFSDRHLAQNPSLTFQPPPPPSPPPSPPPPPPQSPVTQRSPAKRRSERLAVICFLTVTHVTLGPASKGFLSQNPDPRDREPREKKNSWKANKSMRSATGYPFRVFNGYLSRAHQAK